MIATQPRRLEQSDIGLLNEDRAWQLLDLDRLQMRAQRPDNLFAWPRLVTALNCYKLIDSTGMFGSAARIQIEHPFLADGPQPSFGQAVNFLDLTSDWIKSEEICIFLHRCFLARVRPHGLTILERLVTDLIGMTGPPYVSARGGPVWDLHERGVNTEQALLGFYKYLDLSVDIFSFVETEKSGRRWFQICFAAWYSYYADLVLELLDRPLANGDDQTLIWSERWKAVHSLREVAWDIDAQASELRFSDIA